MVDKVGLALATVDLALIVGISYRAEMKMRSLTEKVSELKEHLAATVRHVDGVIGLHPGGKIVEDMAKSVQTASDDMKLLSGMLSTEMKRVNFEISSIKNDMMMIKEKLGIKEDKSSTHAESSSAELQDDEEDDAGDIMSLLSDMSGTSKQ